MSRIGRQQNQSAMFLEEKQSTESIAIMACAIILFDSANVIIGSDTLKTWQPEL